jgi:hypothetical protein
MNAKRKKTRQPSVLDLARALENELASVSVRAHARDLAREFGVARDLDGARDLAGDIVEALRNNPASDIAGDLTRGLCRDLTGIREFTREFHRAAALAHAHKRMDDRRLARSGNRAADRVRSFLRDLFLAQNPLHGPHAASVTEHADADYSTSASEDNARAYDRARSLIGDLISAQSNAENLDRLLNGTAWDAPRRARQPRDRPQMPRIAQSTGLIVTAAARLLPRADQLRWFEELYCNLWDISYDGGGRREQLSCALRELLRVPQLRYALLAQRRGENASAPGTGNLAVLAAPLILGSLSWFTVTGAALVVLVGIGAFCWVIADAARSARLATLIRAVGRRSDRLKDHPRQR